MTRKILLIAVLIVPILAVFSVQDARAQGVEEEIQRMRKEIESLRSEVESLRKELRGQPPAPGEPTEPSPAEILPVVRAQLQEHAQTKVESTSKFPMKLFGTIVSNTVWNSGEPNWMDLPNIASSYGVGQPTGSFTSTLRQTRLGASLLGPDIGSMKTSAVVAMDFFGGVPNFATGQTMGTPRLLYAYMRFDSPRTTIEVGQDHMILAPQSPTSLAADSFPLLYRSGNLYLRAPQIRAERLIATGRFGELRFQGGILAPVAGDLAAPALQFVPPTLAGERSRMPGFQSRVALRAVPAGPYEKPSWEFGGSGHYSRERYLTGVVPSWAAAFDFDAAHGRFGTGGELFMGRNIDAFGGSLGQLAQSRGGFIEGRFAATRMLSVNGGYGVDRLFDLVRFPAPLSDNTSVFTNLIYQFTPEIRTSLEYRRLETGAAGAGSNINHHLNLTIAYGF